MEIDFAIRHLQSKQKGKNGWKYAKQWSLRNRQWLREKHIELALTVP